MKKEPPRDVPKVLDAMADVVLAYKPKSKSEAAKRRKNSLNDANKVKKEKRSENNKPN